MPAPRIDDSTREDRLSFIMARYRCYAPACGHCGSCRLPGGTGARETFADYIEGKREYAAIAAALWQDKM